MIDVLDQLLVDVREGKVEGEAQEREVLDGRQPPGAFSPAPKWPSGANQGIGKVRYTHDTMVDLIISNPAISQNELAAHFGYTPGWVSQIISSDAFQARLAERSEQLIDPMIRLSVKQRFESLVLRSMELLQQKLDKPAHQVPDNLVLRTLEVASRAAGYGAKVEVTKTEVNVDVHLEALGNNLTQLLRRRKAEAALPGEFTEITSETVQ